jgi:AcrR family transcriptional regulator
MATTKNDPSARDRLLSAADELFYEEGVHTVGIDRVIERAGVAKASLYATFGSKEGLVRAYLEARAANRRERLLRRMGQCHTAREQILAVFDLLGEVVVEPTFRGCAFVNASAEGPRGPSKIREVCGSTRGWLRGVLTGLAREAGAKDPELVGRRLALLYEGAVVGASMGDDARAAAADARGMAVELLDAHAAPSTPRDKTHAGETRRGRRTGRS